MMLMNQAMLSGAVFLLIPECRRQQSSGGLEASVQLIHCPGCAGGATSSTHNTLLGAKVTVTDPAAAASAGQVREGGGGDVFPVCLYVCALVCMCVCVCVYAFVLVSLCPVVYKAEQYRHNRTHIIIMMMGTMQTIEHT